MERGVYATESYLCQDAQEVICFNRKWRGKMFMSGSDLCDRGMRKEKGNGVGHNEDSWKGNETEEKGDLRDRGIRRKRGFVKWCEREPNGEYADFFPLLHLYVTIWSCLFYCFYILCALFMLTFRRSEQESGRSVVKLFLLMYLCIVHCTVHCEKELLKNRIFICEDDWLNFAQLFTMRITYCCNNCFSDICLFVFSGGWTSEHDVQTPMSRFSL